MNSEQHYDKQHNVSVSLPPSPPDDKHQRAWWSGTGATLAGMMGIVDNAIRRMRGAALHGWEATLVRAGRGRVSAWYALPFSGVSALLAGTALITLLVAGLDRVAAPLQNPGILYLPLIGMLAYHWNWRLGALAGLLQLGCVYWFFLPPANAFKALGSQGAEQLVTLALVDAFILALVRLARTRRDLAERDAQRFAALNTVGTALAGELDEPRLLQLIARTARDLTGAGFAAFTLRPVDPLGRPTVPAEGTYFHLAAVVGVTPEQEAVFRRIPLGGEGLLAPIFRQGVVVRVADALALTPAHRPKVPETRQEGEAAHVSPRDAARAQAMAFAQGDVNTSALHGVGVPHGHPVVRSFLGAPLLDRDGQVRGGLLLGHLQPGRFTADDEMLLHALATQAAVALENARLYRAAQTRARELDAIFESIADGVALVDAQGNVRQENRAAEALRGTGTTLDSPSDGGGTEGTSSALNAEVDAAVARALAGQLVNNVTVTRADAAGKRREYLVSASPLRGDSDQQADHAKVESPAGVEPGEDEDGATSAGAVVVWHDVTETRQLLAEQQAHAQAEAQRTLLQMMIDELPSGVYLVRGRDAQLVLANRAAMDVWGAQWPVGESMAAFLAVTGTQILAAGGQPLSPDELATVRALRTGEAVHHYQEIIRRPDGTALPVLLNAVTLDAQILHGLLPPTRVGSSESEHVHLDPADPADPAVLVVLQDVTALKEAERLKDEFIAIAAHELKTPMAAVKGYADMLRRRSELDEQSRLAAWQTEALETIDQATSRLVELTNDLLDVTRIQAGRLELRPEPHDLVALARRVVKRFKVTTDRHTLRVAVEGDAEFVVACLDVSRTEQVVGNLLSNAIKYSPEGGLITVGIREDTGQGLAELRVQDRGIGIPQTQQAHLFRRFARADNARELGIVGTGLGLYLCRELVERQGGHIWFTSSEGLGTTVYFTLPLATE